jgi:outer membrane protein OmpA-like peptidoglycan-associated protein
MRLAIAQIRRGEATSFELCPVAACPTPTPKTLTNRREALAALPAISSPAIAAGTADPTPVGPTPLQPPVRVVADTISPAPAPIKTIVVTFASGSALLTAATRRQLEAILPEAQRSPTIDIRGRTDELGSASLNDVLARNRALAVRDYLRALHLSEQTTIHLSAKGACCYVADNDTKEGRAANRRVEIEYHQSMQLAGGTPHESY